MSLATANNSVRDRAQPAADQTGPAVSDGLSLEAPSPVQAAELEPLTISLLGRFFAVPLLIVGIIVGGAITVVLLFGGPANPPRRSVDELLQVLESNSGARSLGVLLPREKELWQAAQELTIRLQRKQAELTPEETDTIADRLARLVRSDLQTRENVVSLDEERAAQLRLRSNRLQFAIHALGRTETSTAVDVLVEIVRSGVEPFVADAVQELGNLYQRPDADGAVEPMTAALLASKRPETLLSACTALSVLARPKDQSVVDALVQTRARYEGEVGWSASLALARLGSSAGRSTLMDLLDRSFWEQGERYEVQDASGQVRRYAMPQQRIEQWLLAAIDASAHVSDADLWERIERLQSDASPAVRGRAKQAVRERA